MVLFCRAVYLLLTYEYFLVSKIEKCLNEKKNSLAYNCQNLIKLLRIKYHYTLLYSVVATRTVLLKKKGTQVRYWGKLLVNLS